MNTESYTISLEDDSVLDGAIDPSEIQGLKIDPADTQESSGVISFEFAPAEGPTVIVYCEELYSTKSLKVIEVAPQDAV